MKFRRYRTYSRKTRLQLIKTSKILNYNNKPFTYTGKIKANFSKILVQNIMKSLSYLSILLSFEPGPGKGEAYVTILSAVIVWLFNTICFIVIWIFDAVCSLITFLINHELQISLANCIEAINLIAPYVNDNSVLFTSFVSFFLIIISLSKITVASYIDSSITELRNSVLKKLEASLRGKDALKLNWVSVSPISPARFLRLTYAEPNLFAINLMEMKITRAGSLADVRGITSILAKG